MKPTGEQAFLQDLLHLLDQTHCTGTAVALVRTQVWERLAELQRRRPCLIDLDGRRQPAAAASAAVAAPTVITPNLDALPRIIVLPHQGKLALAVGSEGNILDAGLETVHFPAVQFWTARTDPSSGS